jgi:hypothetical protein
MDAVDRGAGCTNGPGNLRLILGQFTCCGRVLPAVDNHYFSCLQFTPRDGLTYAVEKAKTRCPGAKASMCCLPTHHRAGQIESDGQF